MSLISRFRKLTKVVAVVCALLLAPGDAVFLMAQDAPPPPGPPPPSQAPLAPGQLDSLVAPIALYPDPLVSQILVASTYPLELVEAKQWLQRNPGLNGPALTQGAQQQNWDPSIQALVIFPDLVSRLTQDITWTTDLGNAFLAQQGDVMDAVQRMRMSAQQAGKLPSTPQQKVIQTTDAGRPVIDIEPVDPGMIYIPEYDPALIWGPPAYFWYPHWWNPYPGIGLVGGAFFGFGLGISIGGFFGGGWGGWGGWGWRPGWGSRSVIVNNNFIHRYNFNGSHMSGIHGTSAWSHDASHRQGVPYPNRSLSSQYRAPQRANLAPRNVPGRSSSAGAAQESRGNFGSRQIAPSTSSRGAFGGVENRDAARVHSDHGYSSLGPSRSSGGGGRSGGGGGRQGGGGGGRR
jgi:hypothetical protein